MIEQYSHLLNCREYLRESLPLVIESFVEFYGEEKRKEIEEKFSKAIFLAYRTPEALELQLNGVMKEITNEIIERYRIQSKITLSLNDLTDNTSFKNESIIPISVYHKFYDLYKLGPEGREEKFKNESYETLVGRLPEFTRDEYEEMVRTQRISSKYDSVHPIIRNNLKYYIDTSNAEKLFEKAYHSTEALLHKIDPAITMDNFSYYIDNPDIQALNFLAENYPNMLAEYQSRIKEYEKYQQESDNHKNLRYRLIEKYHFMLIDENKDLLPEEELKTVELMKQNPNKYYKLPPYTTFLFGYTINSNSPLDSFGEDAENILQNSEASTWRKEEVKRNRIKFFQMNGIDLGSDYESYVKSEEAKRVWPTNERIKQFQESRDRLLNDYNNEYYTNIPSHIEARKELESLGLLSKEDSFNARMYTTGKGSLVSPNLIKTKNGYESFPIVVINCDQLSGMIDHDIFHELNHLYELSLKEVTENSFEAICGWDILKGDINQQEVEKVNTLEKDDDKRKYELFSEIINELLAQEIYQKMLQKHQHIFDSEEKAQVKHVTSYEHTFFLVKDFYEEFKKEIIESRRNGNIQIILDTVGKENFDALNELFHEFYENFSGFRIYSLLQSLQNKEDTKQTRAYFDLLSKRNKILDQMRKYSMREEQTKEIEEKKEK